MARDDRYLPPFLRDFHDQKAVFKLIAHATRNHPSESEGSAPSWPRAMTYTIDRFLWAMGQYGWKLQRRRDRGEWADMDADLKALEEHRAKVMRSALAKTEGG